MQNATNKSEMKEFTLEELAEYNGVNGKKAYVAYQGQVYDVTDESSFNSIHSKFYPLFMASSL